MTSKRMYFVLLSLVGLMVIGLLGGAYGVNSLMGSEADKLTGLKAKQQALDQEQVGLSRAKKDIAKYAGLEKITRSVVPEDKSQAEGVREIVKIAAANNISLASITFPASTLGSTATGVKVAPSAGSSNAGRLSQLTAIKNIAGVYQLPITITGDSSRPVPYSKFISFLDALEHNRRTAQVSTVTLQPDINDRNLLTFNLTVMEYIKP
jgi:hypothetical protein